MAADASSPRRRCPARHRRRARAQRHHVTVAAQPGHDAARPRSRLVERVVVELVPVDASAVDQDLGVEARRSGPRPHAPAAAPRPVRDRERRLDARLLDRGRGDRSGTCRPTGSGDRDPSPGSAGSPRSTAGPTGAIRLARGAGACRCICSSVTGSPRTAAAGTQLVEQGRRARRCRRGRRSACRGSAPAHIAVIVPTCDPVRVSRAPRAATSFAMPKSISLTQNGCPGMDDHHVAGLEVAVHDAGAVRRAEARRTSAEVIGVSRTGSEPRMLMISPSDLPSSRSITRNGRSPAPSTRPRTASTMFGLSIRRTTSASRRNR